MATQTPTLDRSSDDKAFFIFTAVVSVAALLFLGWLLMWREAGHTADWNLRFMPAVNATLNSISALCLVLAYRAIRQGKRRQHQWLMISAFVASAVFLVGYVAYHFVHGDTKYAGEGLLRGVYFFVLASHVLLSMSVVPLALTSFYLAFKGQFARHKKVTRWTFPIWLYVSVTGVVIFFFLRNSLPAVV